MKTELVPAILENTKKNFLKKLRAVEPYAKIIQIDFQDGKFTRTKTITSAALKGVKTKLKLDFHLMIKNVGNNLDKYIKLKPYRITFQYEGCKDILGCINKIKKRKIKAGIAINPETPVEKIKPYISKVNLILVMTVHPGKQGQKIVSSSLKKVKQLRKMKPKMNIQVDGGIKKTNIGKIKKAGANIFVVGSAIVKQKDIKKEILSFKNLLGGK